MKKEKTIKLIGTAGVILLILFVTSSFRKTNGNTKGLATLRINETFQGYAVDSKATVVYENGQT